jgi:DNA gyrase subunit B
MERVNPVDNDPNHIVVLEQLEAIRRRPGMYIGGPDIIALHNMVNEVIDPSIDEALAGRVSLIEVILREDCEVCIRDNGPGLPVDLYEPTQRSKLEMLFTKFRMPKEKLGLGPYPITGGFDETWLCPVNALSEWLVVETTADGILWRQAYKMGKPQTPVEKMRTLAPGESTGVSITFKPDFTIFTPNSFAYDTLAQRCRETAYQVAGLTIHLQDERQTPTREETFHAPGGLATLVTELTQSARPLHQPIGSNVLINVTEYQRQIGLQFAFVFTQDEVNTEMSFANITRTSGGTHIEALRRGILKFVNRSRNGNPPKPFRWKNIASHVAATISVLHPDVMLLSQTRPDLMNPEVVNPIANAVYKTFAEFVAAHPAEMQEILRVCRASSGSH